MATDPTNEQLEEWLRLTSDATELGDAIAFSRAARLGFHQVCRELLACRERLEAAFLREIDSISEMDRLRKQIAVGAIEMAAARQENERLRERLGCAIEELERRCPFNADPLTTSIVRDGRAALAEPK